MWGLHRIPAKKHPYGALAKASVSFFSGSAAAEDGVQILLRGGGGLQPVGVHQDLHHRFRQERRQRGPQVDVLHAQRQQAQEDTHRLLLVPRQHQRQRQVVDGAAEGLRQRQRHRHGAVGVVALAHVQDTGQAADLPQIQIVEAVLAAGQRQHQRVHGRLFHELRVVIAAGVGAVAAAHQKDVLHRAALDGGDHRLRVGQYRRVAEAGGQHVAAVDAAHAVVVVVAAQRQRLLDEGGEVLAAVFVGGDVGQAVVAHHGGGVHPVGVAGTGRHQAVGGEQHRRGDGVELRLLALPRGAEVARQMGVGLQPGVAVGGQHLAVGVDVDALALRLLQQLVEIRQIVAGHHDERALFDVRVHPRGHGIAEGAGVGLVQQGHAPEVHLPERHDERQPLLHGVVAVDGAQALIEPVCRPHSRGSGRGGRRRPCPSCRTAGWSAGTRCPSRPSTGRPPPSRRRPDGGAPRRRGR